jgi:hypothetical protein
MRSERTLSSGDEALILLDDRHRIFAASDVGVDRLLVFVLVRADAAMSY